MSKLRKRQIQRETDTERAPLNDKDECVPPRFLTPSSKAPDSLF